MFAKVFEDNDGQVLVHKDPSGEVYLHVEYLGVIRIAGFEFDNEEDQVGFFGDLDWDMAMGLAEPIRQAIRLSLCDSADPSIRH